MLPTEMGSCACGQTGPPPPIEAWPCSGFLPVQREIFAAAVSFPGAIRTHGARFSVHLWPFHPDLVLILPTLFNYLIPPCSN